MSKNLRQLLFMIVLLISVGLISVVLLYASGYSINWKERSLIATGGISVVTQPRRAKVLIDPLAIEQVSPAYLSGLTAGSYHLTVSQIGYTTAIYDINLQPHQVISLEPVILWPTPPVAKTIAIYPTKLTAIKSSLIKWHGVNTTLLWNNRKNQALLLQPQALSLYDYSSRKQRQLLRQAAPISEVVWHPSNDYIFYVSNDTVRALDIRTDYGRNDTALYSTPDLHDVRVDSSGGKLYFSDADHVYQLDLR